VKEKMGKVKSIRGWYLLLILVAFIAVITSWDFYRISKYDVPAPRPVEKIQLEQDQIYMDLTNGKVDIDWNRLDGTLDYISREYDCADFRLVNLIRILYEYEQEIPPITLSKIKEVLFNFRYWWDQPGENSMCYWSENHQILFASAEYLIGQKFATVTFHASGLTGAQHAEKAKKRILDWLEMRWNYGFTEFYSGVYYKEDIGAMINLIDFAEDKEISEKTKIIMDVLFYDIATQNIKTMFITASGRAYEGNRKGNNSSDVGGLTNYFWGDGGEIRSGMMYGMMTTENYSLPEVLVDIARDTSNVVIRQSNGMDLIELSDEGYFGTSDRSMMMQWGMEAFTNPMIVRNTLAHMRSTKMFSNDFLKDMKVLDFTLFKWLRLEPLIVKMINPQSNGVAIQKGNTYTYKTKDYTLYTTQNYHPGHYGDQVHISGMNFSNHTSMFHLHPALEKGVENQSPNYWVGYGHLPHTVQEGKVSLAIYNIPKKKGMMELDLLDYTHAFFPSEKFDTTIVEENYAFAKWGESYGAFITANSLSFRANTTDDLIQEGKQTYWITEAGSKSEDGSFEAFCQRVKSNQVSFDASGLTLRYSSNGKALDLTFGESFSIDDQLVDLDYPRYDSPYVQAKKKDKTITYSFNEKSLHLDFENLVREF